MSNGVISDEAISEEQVTQSYTIKKPSKTISDFDEKVLTLDSYEWKLVFDNNGAPTTPPVVEIVNGLPVWGEDVFGVLRLTYTKQVNYYELFITPEVDTADPESSYQCTVMAIWAGGIETLEITAPDQNGSCKGGSFYFGPGEDGDPSTQPEGDEGELCYKRIIKVNACTGEKLSDEVVQVACAE